MREGRDKGREKKRRNESEKEQRGDFVEFRGQPGEKAQKRGIERSERERQRKRQSGTKKKGVRVCKISFASL